MNLEKPLKIKAYGSIGHLPGSRLEHAHKLHGTGFKSGIDFGISEGQAKICTEKTRDRRERIIVQEKLDGSNVAIARVNGRIVPLQRKGYLAISSPYEQHRRFATWVYEQSDRFDFLQEGERLCGEWLIQAHGTRYLLSSPFVVFDLFTSSNNRVLFDDFIERTKSSGLVHARLLSDGPALSIEKAIELLDGGSGYHGAIDIPEGAVWRCEKAGKVLFLAKFVRPEKVDGKYLPDTECSVNSGVVIWNKLLDPEKWHLSKALSVCL